MRERIPDKNIWLIYAAVFILGLAYGDSIALTSLHLDAVGFTKAQIGSLAAWFAGGIVLMSLPAGGLVRRFSAKWTLVVAMLGYAVAVALFGFQRDYASVAAIRFVDGACSVAIWVSCETILLSRSSPQNKAFVTSLYAMAMALGYAGGGGVARGLLALTTMPWAFVAAGVLAILGTALVAARLDRDTAEPHVHEVTHHAASDEQAPSPQGTSGLAPSPQGTSGLAPSPQGTSDSHAPQAGLSGPELAWRIKTSCFATFSYGYFQASVVLFLPLYLVEQKHVDKAQTVLMPAIFALGMLLFANQAGKFGDRHGHLRVMRILAAIGTAMVLGFVFLDAWIAMEIAIFVAGATLAAISPVSLALQGKVAHPRDYARANAIYNVFYAAGMLLGPPVSSRLFQDFGGAVMLYHLAALWGSFVLFTTVFAKDDPAARKVRIAAVTAPREELRG
ncbi:MAG: MFS transporter [Polyangiaceae bacterium]